MSEQYRNEIFLNNIEKMANGDDGIFEAISQFVSRLADAGTISEQQQDDFDNGVWSLGLVAEDNS